MPLSAPSKAREVNVTRAPLSSDFTGEFSVGFSRVSRIPKTMKRFVTVRRDSAVPCSQSTLARMSWYWTLAKIPAGMVAKTKARRNWKPKLAVLGVLVSGRERKNLRLGEEEYNVLEEVQEGEVGE